MPADQGKADGSGESGRIRGKSADMVGEAGRCSKVRSALREIEEPVLEGFRDEKTGNICRQYHGAGKCHLAGASDLGREE